MSEAPKYDRERRERPGDRNSSRTARGSKALSTRRFTDNGNSRRASTPCRCANRSGIGLWIFENRAVTIESYPRLNSRGPIEAHNCSLPARAFAAGEPETVIREIEAEETKLKAQEYQPRGALPTRSPSQLPTGIHPRPAVGGHREGGTHASRGDRPASISLRNLETRPTH